MALCVQGRSNVMLMTVFIYILLGVTLQLCTASQKTSVMISFEPSGVTSWLSDACHLGCVCRDWEKKSELMTGIDQIQDGICKQEGIGRCGKRFMVNCTAAHPALRWLYTEFGVPRIDEAEKALYLHAFEVDFVNVVQSLPQNTTDLIISDFIKFQVGNVLFLIHQHPRLFTFTLNNCWGVVILSNVFQGVLFKSSIRSIYIHDNELLEPHRFQKGIFGGLDFVEIISVVNNTIVEALQTKAFYDLPEVKIINLTRNCLQEIQSGAFHNLPHLTTLDLSHNFLEAIPGEDIIELSRSSLKELYLEGNWWTCSCEMVWILVLNTSIVVDSPVCHSPPELKGTPLQNLTPNHFQHCCRVHIEFIGLLMVFIGVPATSSMCILWNLYRHYRSLKSKILIGQIEMDTNLILGHNVYKGRLKDGCLVAVKKVPPLSMERSKELDILLHMSKSALPHPNVVRYFIKEETRKATYIALELCNGNLRNLMRKATSWKDDILSKSTTRDCLYQIIDGLHHLHDHGIEHRDIKPSNILWSDNKSGKLRFIISDFDMGHFTKDQSCHKPFGSMGWRAPEFQNEGSRTSAVDIFSMGCVFFSCANKRWTPIWLTQEHGGVTGKHSGRAGRC